MASLSKNSKLSSLIKILLSLESGESEFILHANALLFADDRNQQVCVHAAAVVAVTDCSHSRCRRAYSQHADHRTAAHSPMCVDRRKQTLRTRKTSRRLAAKHKVGCRPQRSQ